MHKTWNSLMLCLDVCYLVLKSVKTNDILINLWYSKLHLFCQWLAAGLWFSPGTLVSSTNKTDWHDIAEILLKVALNNIRNLFEYILEFLKLFKRKYFFYRLNVYFLEISYCILGIIMVVIVYMVVGFTTTCAISAYHH